MDSLLSPRLGTGRTNKQLPRACQHRASKGTAAAGPQLTRAHQLEINCFPVPHPRVSKPCFTATLSALHNSNQELGLSPIVRCSTRLPPAQAQHLVWGTHHQVKVFSMITQSLCSLGQSLPQGKTDQMHYFVMPGAQGWDTSHGSFGVAALHSHHPSLDTAWCSLPTPG